MPGRAQFTLYLRQLFRSSFTFSLSPQDLIYCPKRFSFVSSTYSASFQAKYTPHRKLRYVKLLKTKLDILAGGDLDCPVTVKGQDELGELASGIDQMRCSILAHQSGEEQLCHFIRQSLSKVLQIKDMADKLFEYFLVYSSEWESTQLELADASRVLEQFWGEYVFSLENKGFMKAEFCPLGGNLRINLNLLCRTFDSLYSNLLKYADPAHPVKLAYSREGGGCVLPWSIISPRRDRREGTNIGLNTCFRVIQYHGRSFQAKEADGLFQVTVTLPLIDH